jgi:hypothetical protein
MLTKHKTHFSLRDGRTCRNIILTYWGGTGASPPTHRQLSFFLSFFHFFFGLVSVVMVVVGVLCVEKSLFCVLCVCCYVLRPEEGIYYTHTHTQRDIQPFKRRRRRRVVNKTHQSVFCHREKRERHWWQGRVVTLFFSVGASSSFFFLELFIFLRQSQQSQKKDMTWIADSLPRGFGLRMDIGLVDCATTTSGLQSVDFFWGGGF